MSIIKEAQELLESKARIKIALIVWIALLLLFIIPTTSYPGMKDFAGKYSIYYVPVLILLTALLMVEIGFAIAARYNKKKAEQDTQQALEKAAQAEVSNTRKKFDSLPPGAINILKFWNQPGNRYKSQRLGDNDENRQTLSRAKMIHTPGRAIITANTPPWEDYTIVEWAADFIEAHPDILERKS